MSQPEAPEAPASVVEPRPTISGCVVARNEERLIERCLASFADLVDEIVFVHDGECTDRTLEIAERYGCRIFVQPLRGHADASKVFAFSQARSEWILGVDADEFLSTGLREHLHELVRDPDVNGYRLLWPFWDGHRYVSSPEKSWRKLQLYRRSALHAVGNLHLTIHVDEPVLDVDHHLEHRPEYNNWTLRTTFTKWRAWARVSAREYLSDYSELPTFNWQGPHRVAAPPPASQPPLAASFLAVRARRVRARPLQTPQRADPPQERLDGVERRAVRLDAAALRRQVPVPGLPRRDVSPGAAPLVAVVTVGDPASPTTWSGTTAGILAALRELGVPTHPIDLKLPPGLEEALLVGGAARTRNRFDAESAALTVRIRSALLRRRLRGLRLDGIVQVGSTFQVPADIPYVTLEDMTLRQSVGVHPVFGRMSPAAIEKWERRRAQIYAGARRCTVASHWAADSLERDYALEAPHTAVVGLGANHRIEVQGARSWASPRFLFIGIDWERKGGPVLLRAFARLREERPDVGLDVVGAHPRLEQAGVQFHGVLSHADPGGRHAISELFAQATCLVMPSTVEPFGIVHVEAASAGIPSIGTSVGGPRDIIGADGGIVVDPGDEDGLHRAMLRLCDAETARGMGAAAAQRALLYTWDQVAERLLRALELQAPDGRELAAFL
ncbi:MAG: glycosyltransferase [Solirubrobacteraceae bacterium]